MSYFIFILAQKYSMYEKHIKEWLLIKQPRVYSVIVSTYYQKILDLKPTLFRKWLAQEIDIPEEKINLSSLNSALTRLRKDNEKKNKREKAELTITSHKTGKDRSEDFHFSSVDTTPQKSRTTEL